ncbi:MAG: pirin family protein [Candidatus Eremiobacteraeota bacterium]|nr:pirin family protein [Candidatus Eremiobacteraeota bacterium]
MKIVRAERFVEGGGFVVHRPFPVHDLSYFDPILLIDEMGPVQYGPGEAIGAPDHPHRGFETVTYVIEGEMQHEDSHGHRGAIRDGDVQWMTAGAGVVHSEMPSPEIMKNGGRMHGFQIWINLPREKKMTQPRYQEYSSAHLPLVNQDGVWVRVIAGEYAGKRSPIETTVPTTMLHMKLQPGATANFTIAPESNAVVHTIEGSGVVENRDLHKHDVALIERAAEMPALKAGKDGFEVLFLSGVPLNEPVARYGPFVMNDVNELQQAFDDYRSGRFGEIARVGAS